MDYNKLIHKLTKKGSYIDLEAATAIDVLQVENQALRNAANGFKNRLELAEKERDEALELIGWIYYEACVSVEHDMRQHIDWIKDKIEEWKKNKEE